MNIGENRLGNFSGAFPSRTVFYKTIKSKQIFKVIDRKKASFEVIDEISREHFHVSLQVGKQLWENDTLMAEKHVDWMFDFRRHGDEDFLWSRILINFSFLCM